MEDLRGYAEHSSCSGAILGAERSDCDSTYECVAGSYCSASPPCGGGKCQSYNPIGTDCEARPGPCVPGAACVPGDQSLAYYRCMPFGNVGDPCHDFTNGFCLPMTTYCNRQTWLCEPRQTQDPCRDDLDCLPGICGGNPRDVRHCTTRRNDGDGCVPGQYQCSHVSYCDDTGVCRAMSALGGPCGYIDPNAVGHEIGGCLDGWCNIDVAAGKTEGTCAPWRTIGAACTGGQQCASGWCSPAAICATGCP
jgi:hypothetical protein